MRHFWQGFDVGRQIAPIRFKKHVIVLLWRPDEKLKTCPEVFTRTTFKYPSVAVKIINIGNDMVKPKKHHVLSFPTALLLRDGREVDRVDLNSEQSLLETLFRRAQV